VNLIDDIAGAPTRFDLQAAAQELAARLQSTGFPHDWRRAVQAINPHLRAWYAAWQKPQREPWTVYGSVTQAASVDCRDAAGTRPRVYARAGAVAGASSRCRLDRKSHSV